MMPHTQITDADVREPAGFTLIEVVIAMAIFAIGFLAIANMQIGSINRNASARWATEAGHWAQDQAERLMNLEYNDANLALGNHPPAPRVEGGVYRITWNVQDNAGAVARTKLVTVTVIKPFGSITGAKRARVQFVKADDIGGPE